MEGTRKVFSVVVALILLLFCCRIEISIHPPATIIQDVNPKGLVHTSVNKTPDLRGVPSNAQFNNTTCRAKRGIVFIKTHKTGSTTMSSMMERYGYYRNYTFVTGNGFIFSREHKFTRKLAITFPGMRGRPYDMLTNHAIYNRKEMELLVPNASYITIIRNPETQLESSFAYFNTPERLHISSEPNPFKTFMADPRKYYNKALNKKRWFQTRNGLLYDLGFDHRYDEDDAKIKQKVAEIEEDFDLILLMEYFDQSLILMKKLLCWDFDDIFYLRKNTRRGDGERGKRFQIDEDTKRRVREWSAGDVQLYDALNKTFWKRVAEYGPGFEVDLQYFRVMNSAIARYCKSETPKVALPDELQGRVVNCTDLKRGDIGYTNLIRESMTKRFGGR